MKNRTLITISIILGILAASCTGMGKVVKENIYFRSGKKNINVCYNLILAGVQVKSGLEQSKIEENTRFIFDLLSKEYKQKKEDGTSEKTDLFVYLILKEEVFVKEFESRNTVGLELECYIKEDKDPAYNEITALYTEETENTIASYAYLYSILEKTFTQIF